MPLVLPVRRACGHPEAEIAAELATVDRKGPHESEVATSWYGGDVQAVQRRVAPRSLQDQVASGAPEVPCRVVGEGEEPEPEPEPAAAQPPVALFDPAVLAQVARIQAAAPTVPVQGCV